MTVSRTGRRRTTRQLVLRVTLRDIEPPVWRLVHVPEAFTLHQLHRVLQIAFSWLDYHLYEFRIGHRRFEAPDPEADDEVEDSMSVRLADIDLRAGAKITYLYDFGDGWTHDIVVERVIAKPLEGPQAGLPRLLDGARAAPPEDAGGPHGHERLLEALADASHPEHEDMRAWVGEQYDPGRFDPWSLDRALALAAGWGAI